MKEEVQAKISAIQRELEETKKTVTVQKDVKTEVRGDTHSDAKYSELAEQVREQKELNEMTSQKMEQIDAKL